MNPLTLLLAVIALATSAQTKVHAVVAGQPVNIPVLFLVAAIVALLLAALVLILLRLLIEALIADVAMVVCSLLALGMACAGQSAKIARLLVLVFAGLSAGMNYLAADVSSFRSVAVYVMPPAVFAVCTDQTVAVIRRHGLASPRIPRGPSWAASW